MTNTNNLPAKSIHQFSLSRLMLFGLGLGLAVILFFILQVDHPNPEWPKYWMVRPLIITPLAGISGGILYYRMDGLRSRGGWRAVLAYLISFIGWFIALWMGIVLGLAGTMWH